MKDANDLHRAGVNLRELGDKAEPYRPNGNGKTEVSSLVTRCAADIEPEAINWIWQDRLARGKHTAIAGEPGLGKSQFGIFVAATITKGGLWPNNEGPAPQGRVVILSAEDGAADTIVPRLIAAGADLKMVEILEAVSEGEGVRAFNLQKDLRQLETKLLEFGDVALVLIDPLSAYLGKGIDSHKDPEVRGVLSPVSHMAGEIGVAILSISHFNKSNSGQASTKALHKFMGSIAFTAAPRVAFAIVEDAEDRFLRLFLHVKNNLASPPPGLAFRITHEIIGRGIWAPRVAWEKETVNMTADEAVAASRGKAAPTLEEAKQFLTAIIGTDGLDVKEIEKEAKAACMSWATVRRAKDELGIKAVKVGFDGWMWKRHVPSSSYLK